MPTAATAAPVSSDPDRDVPLPLRGDTFFGICEAVGQDLGFNPNWLRSFFAVLLLWNPEVSVAAYLGLGLVVAATRFFLPVARTAANVAESEGGANAEESMPAIEVEKEKALLAA